MVKYFHHALELTKAIKCKSFKFNVFMVLFGHGIGECLLMACLGHVGSLKLKQKFNCNYVKIEIT